MKIFDRQLASRRDRLFAKGIDFLITVLIIIVSVFFSSFSGTIAAVIAYSGLLFALFYILCADGLKNGQSYGKQIRGICVIDATSGKPCTFFRSLLRNICIVILGYMDWTFIFLKKRQRLGDIIANTIVVDRKVDHFPFDPSPLPLSQQHRSQSQRKPRDEAQLMQRLQLIAGGDQATVQRLIEYERKRHPSLNRAELMRFAIDRWERDNR